MKKLKMFFIFILITFFIFQVVPLGNVYNLGNLNSGDTITIYIADTVNLATVYDGDGGSQISNPIVVGSNGQYNFYVDNGLYDFAVAGNGFDSYTVENVKVQDPRKLNDNEKLVFGTNNNMKLYWNGYNNLEIKDKWDKVVIRYISIAAEYGGLYLIQRRKWNDPSWEPLLNLVQLEDGENCIRWMHKRGSGPNDFWLMGIPVQPEKMPFVIFHDKNGLAFGIEENTLRIQNGRQQGVGESWEIIPQAISHVYHNRRLSNDKKNNSFTEDMMFIINNSDWTTYKTLCPSSLNAQCRGIIKVEIGGHTESRGNGVIETIWFFDINDGTLSVGQVGTPITSGNSPCFRLVSIDNGARLQVRSNDGAHTFKGTMQATIFAPRDWSGNLLYQLQ
jgi:hypothetical protein